MYRPLVTKILEEASKCYGDDSPLEDPMLKSVYSSHEIKEAVRFCRSAGLLGKRAVFGKNVEIGKWWAGGLTLEGMAELENRQRSVRSYKNRIRSARGEYLFEE